MPENYFVMKGFNDSNLYVRVWARDDKPIAGLHILHGLGEHSQRYDSFAQFMTQEGFVVICHDHRQHGQSIAHDTCGIFNEKDTWEAIVEDVGAVQTEFHKRYSEIPMFMLGHSMGSLILRAYLQMYPTELAGVIVMGTPVSSNLMARAGVAVAGAVEWFGKGKRSPMLDKMATGSFIKSVKDPRTPFDWITQDETIVDGYIADPLCAYVYSPLFYKALSQGLLVANNTTRMKSFPKIPTMFVSGRMDPCGLMGKGVTKVSKKYRMLGIDNQLVLMDDMRHEVLNEKQRKSTFELVSRWLMEQSLNEEK